MEHKQAPRKRQTTTPKTKSRGIKHSNHYSDLGRRTVAEDWSMASGRVTHMNDPKEDSKVFSFVESATQESAFSTSTTVPIATGTFFSLSGLPNATAYASLFDQYRICQIELWALPTGSAAVEQTGLFKSVVDYDNTATTATTSFFDGYSNTHTSTLANGHYRRYTPHVAIAAYSGAFTSYANRSMQWIDCASTTVQHYGVKYYTDVTSSVVPIDLVYRVWIQFRNKI
jgi:hypothetical protein